MRRDCSVIIYYYSTMPLLLIAHCSPTVAFSRDSLSNSSLRDSLTANDLVSLEYMFGDQDSAGVSC